MPRFTVITFNTHGGVRPRRRGRRHDPFPLAEVLAGFDADLLVLQEVWRPDNEPAAVDVAAAARGDAVLEVDFGRGIVDPWPHLTPRHAGRGRFGVAVLSALPIVKVAEPVVANVPVDPLDARRVLHARVEVGATPVDLVAVHLTSRLPHGPPLQLRSLSGQLPDGGPAMVVGDCNFWGPGVTALLPGWRRAARGRTWPANLPHSQIDHVLVRGGVRPVGWEVLPDVGSDHRPLRAELEVP